MSDWNVAKTYYEMTILSGISNIEATKQLCESANLKFSGSYANEWTGHSEPFRAIPPLVVCEMQQRVAVYAAKKAGINTTAEKAMRFAELLSPKTKIKRKQ
ncbi:MAG: hypothetical protein HOM11_09780 [Methylococcales bacterium]|jgi:hypothetical protein|nr:hypothetical protein [Methylococcales bacterium]MBT7444991.1 hypothetical protein [Methylococcales bacterium]